jgi:hypothetical protein
MWPNSTLGQPTTLATNALRTGTYAMKRIAQLSLALAATTIVALGLVMLAPARSSRPAVGDEELATLRTGETTRQTERIDARRDVVFGRLLAKERITGALLRGELTLDQAAERFRELIAGDPAAVAAMQARYGRDGDEIYYHNVLDFARGEARYHPDRGKPVLPGLEAEVSRRFPPPGAAERPVK